MATVAHKTIGKTKESFYKAVKQVMELAEYKKHISKEYVFIKINSLSHQAIPGLCTSPWFLDAVLTVLAKHTKNIYVGDANVATIKQINRGKKNWGYEAICQKHNVTFLNLSETKQKEIQVPETLFKKVTIPQILTEVKSIITLPVLKTHNVSTMTFALKNQWGCLSRIRQQYHQHLTQCIPDINTIIKPCFAIGDATICGEGQGPRNAEPKAVNSVLASADLVALDTAGCQIMGITLPEYITEAERKELGKTTYTVKGDKMPKEQFKQANMTTHMIVKWEMRLRKIPIVNYILFKTPLFHIPAYGATYYNTKVWYKKGLKLKKEFLEKYPLYKHEFDEWTHE